MVWKAWTQSWSDPKTTGTQTCARAGNRHPKIRNTAKESTEPVFGFRLQPRYKRNSAPPNAREPNFYFRRRRLKLIAANTPDMANNPPLAGSGTVMRFNCQSCQVLW